MSKRKEKMLMLFVDFININVAWIFFYYIRFQTGWFDTAVIPDFLLFMTFIYLYWVLFFAFRGLYESWFAMSRLDEIISLFNTSFLGVLIIFFFLIYSNYLNGVQPQYEISILIYWGLFVVFVTAGRLIIRKIQRNFLANGIGRRNTLIVGFNKQAHAVHDSIIKHREFGLDVLGYVAVDRRNLKKEYAGVKVIGTTKVLMEVIKKLSIKNVILALERHQEDTILDVISKCEADKIEIKMVPDLYEIITGHAKTAQLYGMPLMDVMPEIMPLWEKSVKRLGDIFLSLFVIVLTLPLTISVSIAIKLSSRGPIFYRQERVGKRGKLFKIIKFRSMVHEAEKSSGPVWSAKNDPRITRVGNLIRKMRLDEIPQMINILVGDMSFVGPRPERPFFVEKLAEEITYYKRRLRVRPGLTGWAQVKHKYDESIEDVRKKLDYDLFYIENMSLRLDLKILFRTIFVVLFSEGHYN